MDTQQIALWRKDIDNARAQSGSADYQRALVTLGELDSLLVQNAALTARLTVLAGEATSLRAALEEILYAKDEATSWLDLVERMRSTARAALGAERA